MEDGPIIQRQMLLDELAENWRPQDMRDFANTLLRLADAIDQQWHPRNSKSVFRWPSQLHRIEKNSWKLAAQARQEYRHRQSRAEFLPAHLFGEPAWDMLLELFMQFAGGAKVTIKSLCLAANAPTTTALRYIEVLLREGLVRRIRSNTDKRVTFVELSEDGVLAMGNWLTTQ